ncbi:MAG: hypothetical protein ACETV0_01645, partial [Nitrososphaeria archaeon]
TGDNIVVMNCIWVLRRAKGHTLGKQLLENMVESEEDADGFATVALEIHCSPWFRKREIEKLGFKSLDSIEVAHKTKYRGRVFDIHLMWMPTSENAKQPKWNKQRLLEGVNFCMAHPLYHPQTYEEKQILE